MIDYIDEHGIKMFTKACSDVTQGPSWNLVVIHRNTKIPITTDLQWGDVLKVQGHSQSLEQLLLGRNVITEWNMDKVKHIRKKWSVIDNKDGVAKVNEKVTQKKWKPNIAERLNSIDAKQI